MGVAMIRDARQSHLGLASYCLRDLAAHFSLPRAVLLRPPQMISVGNIYEAKARKRFIGRSLLVSKFCRNEGICLQQDGLLLYVKGLHKDMYCFEMPKYMYYC